jgi:uncharacterized protein YjbJ (UPF0337 family)
VWLNVCGPLPQAFVLDDAIWLNKSFESGALCYPERRRKLGQFFWMIQGGSVDKYVFVGKWPQVRAEAKVWWGKLTDDDLDKAAGRLDVFVGMLQEKYGYSRAHAEEEIEQRIAKPESGLRRKIDPTPGK